MATNLPQRARDLFYGLQEAKSDLVGIAIFDRLESSLQSSTSLVEEMWSRRELENYFCREDVLMAFARYDQPNDLFGLAESDRRSIAMREAISEVTQALKTLGRPDPWSSDIKSTDEFLDPLFKAYFKKLSLPLSFRKADYHVLAKFVPARDIDEEITAKLDKIVEISKKASPRTK